jgi:hypothetical protein
MLINRKKLMDYLSLLYPFMGAGKNNTATNVLNYYYREPDSFLAVTNGSLCAFIPIPNTNLDFPSLKKNFKVDGNQFFQTIKNIKAEEVDINLFDTMLRISAVDNKDNKTEVDFAYAPISNATDYLINTPYVVDVRWKDIDNVETAPISSKEFQEALQTCLPYVNTNDGKLSYVYFYKDRAVSANNNSNSEIAIYKHENLCMFPRIFVSKKDGDIIVKAKVDFLSFMNCNQQYYRISGMSEKYSTELIVFINALSNKENYPVIIDKDRYTEQELNASAYYTEEALMKQFNAEQIELNKDELKDMLETVIVNGVDPTYSMLSINGNSIKYEVKYLHLKKSKTIKTKESYPEMSIKINPNVLKNIIDIGADYISIDKKKIVAKTDSFNYICFLGE